MFRVEETKDELETCNQYFEEEYEHKMLSEKDRVEGTYMEF